MSIRSLDVQTEKDPLAWRQRAYYFVGLLAGGYLLLWVAVFNGYAVFYPDSGEYLGVSFYLQPPMYRGIGYSIFIRLVSFGSSPWLIIVAQSAIAIFVLHSVFRFIIGQNRPFEREGRIFLGLVAFLSFGTTLPWFVGQIMPDAFTGLGLLALFLLLYDARMSAERTVLLSAVLGISVGVHLTHLLTISFLVLVIGVLRMFGVCREMWPARSTKGILAFVLVPILCVAGLLAASNGRAGYGYSLSPARPLFLLGRLLESGLAGDFLRERCGIEQFTACQHLQNLPKSSEEFLWGSHPLLGEMGGWSGATGEASRIVSGTIWRSPGRFIAECGKQMLLQFAAITAGSGNYAIRGGREIDGFRELYPGDVPKYLASRQSVGKLAMDAYRLSFLYVFVFWCSFGACILAMFRKSVRTRMANQLFILSLIFLFTNALITGALATVNDRYQARAAWVMALSCAAYAIPALLRRRTTHLVDAEGS